jgi:CRP-like cAMP-binding protein
MTAIATDPLSLLTKKLDRLGNLDSRDREALAALPYRLENVRAGDYLVREGRDTSDCCLLVEGYACRHKLTHEGARQIVSFHLPGDVLDLQHLLFSRADHNVQTITPASVAWIPASELKLVSQEHPRIGEALWRDTLIDASIFREWVLNVGRRDAKSRIAHMLCEFAARSQVAGLGPPERFQLPMTQEHIADATGLTPVHVNRMLRELREEGVIERTGREFRILDWDAMRSVADFDATYLHAAA